MAAQPENSAPQAQTNSENSASAQQPSGSSIDESAQPTPSDKESAPSTETAATEESVSSEVDAEQEADLEKDSAQEESVEEPPNPGTSSNDTADEKEPPPSDEEGWSKLEASSAKLEEVPPVAKPYFRTMVLVEGTARYGAVTIAPPGTTLDEEDPDVYESSVGNLGGQATLGVMPGGSAFLMAGRLRGGSYISRDFTRGNMAAEMLFGANFGRNARGNEFTHILAGFGVEFLPGENQDLLTLSVAAATVVKGVSFGGGLMLEANDEIAIGTLGMQVGWGQLF